jgi:hypothetical protein
MAVQQQAARATSRAGTQVRAWLDDPGPPDAPNTPVEHPVPNIAAKPFPSAIAGRAPAAGDYAPSTAKFRYWTAADALRRVGDLWGHVLGSNVKWHSTVGARLKVTLNAGEDLNAYYDRSGLKFFHGTAGGKDFYSGESPDVVCHEFGHAILDAIRPQLWDVMSAEPPAFHEAFGDMSAMLTALQQDDLCAEVITSTSGKLDRSSRVSRLAEQLGWAIRQGHPDAVDRDCLRNAANSFFYRDPVDLPPRAPASQLSSEPHSFSRVFSGSFLNVLAGMFALQPKRDVDGLIQVAQEAAQLLVDAVQQAPVVVAYFSQVAAHMLAAEQTRFGGRYQDALRSAFVRHGVLALSHAATAPRAAAATAAKVRAATEASLPQVAISGGQFGFDEELVVHVAAEPKRYAVAGAAADLGPSPETTYDVAAASYVEDVFRRGHVEVHKSVESGRVPAGPSSRATHVLRREGDVLVLVRRLFVCGHGSSL